METNGVEGAIDPATNDSNAEDQTKKDEASDNSDDDSDSDDDSETCERNQITAYLHHHPPLHPRR